MARVTVEDCVDKIPNRFELVVMASQRAREISAGAQLNVDRDNDKNPVVSLREIAEGSVSTEELTEDLIKSLQMFVAIDEPDDEDMDLLGIQQDFNSQVDNDAPPELIIDSTSKDDGSDSAMNETDDLLITIDRDKET